ncbi:hypothetical protein H6503_04860 [Candidatus Woesearchaeota archaeon]|nr:hypothetical protein [Candidatus Woesearchaeota archaeon]
MQRPICIATGAFHSWTKVKNNNSHIDIARKLDNIDGVEITLGFKENLYDLKISRRNIDWLRKQKYVSIHAPFHLPWRSNGMEDLLKQLKLIEKLYKTVKAKTVVIHPQDMLPPKILNRFRFHISTENMEPGHNISHAHLKKILKAFPRAGLCLDAAHAYLYSKDETSAILKKFKGKVSQVHLSGTYKKKEHQSMRICTDSFYNSIVPLKKTELPIIIEEDINFTRSIRKVQKEVDFVRDFFKE